MPNKKTTSLPKARSEKLAVQELDGEVLVYDLDRDKAHCLNRPLALVWRACDGKTSVPQLGQLLGAALATEVAEEVIWAALEQLSKLHLLEEKVQRPERAISRRDLVRLAGAAALVPAVVTILAPAPAQAASNCRGQGQNCTSTAQCCAGLRCIGAPQKKCSP